MKKLFKHKKIMVILLILIVGVIGFSKMKGNAEPTMASVNTYELVRKDLVQQITVKAPLDGVDKVDIVSPLNYEVIDIRVKEGDVIKKDDVLAVLDSSEIEKSIDDLNNQIELTQIELNEKLRQDQIQYDKIITNINDQQETYNQNKVLFENGVITQDTLDKSKKDLEQLQKSLESYNVVEGKIVLNDSDIKKLEIQKNNLISAQKDLDKIYIKSPIDGTVTRVNINQGRYAKDTDDNKPMFIIEDLSKLQMKASVSEYDIADISVGQSVDITADILKGNMATGIVERISPTAEQKSGNTMERIIPVTISVTDRPDNLISGVIATAKINVRTSKACFSVPSGAVINNEDGTFCVYKIADDGTAKKIEVTTGIETDLDVEIIGDELKEGMRIIANPDESIVDGTKVNAIEE